MSQWAHVADFWISWRQLRAGARGGHSRAGPPKRVTVPPSFHPLPSLQNVIDFESESETDKTEHIRKRLHALASVSNCTRSQIARSSPPPNVICAPPRNSNAPLMEVPRRRLCGSFSCSALGTSPHEAFPVGNEIHHLPSRSALHLLRVSHGCFHAFGKWNDPSSLFKGFRIAIVCHYQIIMTDASLTGCGAVFEGRPTCRIWRGEFLSWHINRLASCISNPGTFPSIPDK